MYSGIHDVIGNENEMVFDDALLDEVASDPLLQKIMDTMDPGVPTSIGGDVQGHSSRSQAPPNSLPLAYGNSVTPPVTPSRGQTSASMSASTLTPTKQNVIDMLLSKIELSDDQLNKLIEEQKQDASGANNSLDDLLPPAAPAQTPSSSGADVESDLDMLTLDQLRSAQVTSITRISSQAPQISQSATYGSTAALQNSFHNASGTSWVWTQSHFKAMHIDTLLYML